MTTYRFTDTSELMYELDEFISDKIQEALDEAVEEKDEIIADLEEDIEERDNYIKDLEYDLDEANSKIEELLQELNFYEEMTND